MLIPFTQIRGGGAWKECGGGRGVEGEVEGEVDGWERDGGGGGGGGEGVNLAM